MKFTTSQNWISGAYYGDPNWNVVLEQYRQKLKEADLMFPIGAMKCIRHFLEMSDHGLLQICGDKTYRNEHEVSEGVGAHLTPHGSFSTMVNGDAIGKYFEELGGTAMYCEHGENTFTNSVFVAGGKGNRANGRPLDLWQTRAAYRMFIDGFNPADYVKIFEGLNKRLKKTSLEQALLLLRFSNWDTEMFCDFEDVIEAKLPEASDDEKRDLHFALEKIWDHHFPLDPADDDVAFRIARLLYGLGDYKKALELFRFSHKYSGEHYATCFNIGLSQAKLGKPTIAKVCFEKAISLNPAYQPAQMELRKIRRHENRDRLSNRRKEVRR
jgi:hypothetical protein